MLSASIIYMVLLALLVGLVVAIGFIVYEVLTDNEHHKH